MMYYLGKRHGLANIAADRRSRQSGVAGTMMLLSHGGGSAIQLRFLDFLVASSTLNGGPGERSAPAKSRPVCSCPFPLPMPDADPILLELYRHRFEGVADEMGVTLRRTSYSPNIKERLDFSCAVFDGDGALVAQAAHIPVHLGAMPASVDAARAAVDAWTEGDVVVLNDPYEGGTHLPDVTMVSPVFVGEAEVPSFFVASRAHHADVGGMTPGSLPLATELVQEGTIIPPIKLYDGGTLNEALLRTILRNVRTPDERRGDLAAQRAAHSVGAERLQALATSHGADEVTTYARHLQSYSERRTRAALADWPDGTYSFADELEVGDDETATIRATAAVDGETVAFDFTGTDDAVDGNLNAVLPITASACYYVVQGLTGGDIPVNAGSLAPVSVTAPESSLVNADPPHAVAGGNVETSQRIVDTVLGALAQALPDRVPAAGQGTMNNLTLGGTRPERSKEVVSGLRPDGSSFAYYETIGGGMGAGPDGDGLSGVHVHMTNRAGRGRPQRRARAHDEHAQHARRGAGADVSVSHRCVSAAAGQRRGGALPRRRRAGARLRVARADDRDHAQHAAQSGTVGARGRGRRRAGADRARSARRQRGGAARAFLRDPPRRQSSAHRDAGGRWVHTGGRWVRFA